MSFWVLTTLAMVAMAGGASAAAAPAFVQRITCYVQLEANSTSVFTPSPDNYMLLMDMPFTQGRSNSSRVLGRLQFAMFMQPYKEQPIHVMQVLTATFDSSVYRGTIALLGRHVLSDPDDGSEMAIVGGTGHFRFSRGFAFINPPTSNKDVYYLSVHFNLYH